MAPFGAIPISFPYYYRMRVLIVKLSDLHFPAPAPESNLMGDEDDPFVPSNSVRPPQPSISTPVLSPQPTGSFNAAAASRTLSPQLTGGSGYRAPPPPPASRSPLPLAHPSAIPSPSPTSPASVPPQLTALRTEHATLSKSVSDLQTQGVSLEPQTIDAGKEIMDLQAKLISLRSTFESERGNVDKLQTRATEQASEKAKAQSDVISAESELSALRVEKDELDGQVMRDREDIRGMKRRMGELTDETAKLKEAVEKVKKEARQQQGLVTITKKQLATSEAARETTKRELAEAEQEVIKAQREAEEAKLAVEKSEREHAEEKSRSAGPGQFSFFLAGFSCRPDAHDLFVGPLPSLSLVYSDRYPGRYRLGRSGCHRPRRPLRRVARGAKGDPGDAQRSCRLLQHGRHYACCRRASGYQQGGREALDRRRDGHWRRRRCRCRRWSGRCWCHRHILGR